MLRTLALPIVVTVLASACSREPRPPADQPQHALLQDLGPPPLNRPIAPPPSSQPPPQTTQRPGDTPGTLILRDGQPFTGTLSTAATVAVEADRIRVQPDTGAALEIVYRLPTGLALAQRPAGPGRVALEERTSPSATDRRVLVLAGAQVALAEIWQQRAAPITFDLGNGVQLIQGATQNPAQRAAGQYSEAPVRIVEAGSTLATLTIGESTTVQSRGGAYRVLVEVSHLFTPAPGDAGQVGGGYILKAWVVPAG